ncbi:UvrD-helicase domain-containing protein [Flavobacterium beibuense]|nr:ATP-dependent helicase [Flavobacterium beibuense]
MYAHLSGDQKKVLNFNEGTVVVKACPGSGKTYSIAARISRLLREEGEGQIRLGVISFTNTAGLEIEEKLKSDFASNVPLLFPHFLGTIDSFINTFIFLPFGHLIMGCPSRPELVGEPHGSWNTKRYERDYDQYFDRTTYNIKGEIIPLAPYQAFHFKSVFFGLKYYKNDKTVNGFIKGIIDSKERLFKKGYANQADANYVALQVLRKYPMITRNLAHKFTHLLVDECQDTTEVQMAIIDLLHDAGCANIMLVGDRDQSIFEWNDAKPELFDAKFEAWNKILLKENRRSSQLICNFFRNLSSFERIIAVNEEVRDCTIAPEITGYINVKKATKKDAAVITEAQSIASFTILLNAFLAQCTGEGISIDKNNVAVLYRGAANAKYLGLGKKEQPYRESPWIAKHYHVRTLLKGKHLYENGNFAQGYALMERAYFEAMQRRIQEDFHCSIKFINERIERLGMSAHRKEVFSFIHSLPATSGLTIRQWVEAANTALHTGSYPFFLNIALSKAGMLVEEYFGEDSNSATLHPFYFGTVHSAKGKTFKAVLLLLGKQAGSTNYSTILSTPHSNLKDNYKEELRVIYVAISRPAKILKMAVPESDIPIWSGLLQS